MGYSHIFAPFDELEHLLGWGLVCSKLQDWSLGKVISLILILFMPAFLGGGTELGWLRQLKNFGTSRELFCLFIITGPDSLTELIDHLLCLVCHMAG